MADSREYLDGEHSDLRVHRLSETDAAPVATAPILAIFVEDVGEKDERCGSDRIDQATIRLHNAFARHTLVPGDNAYSPYAAISA